MIITTRTDAVKWIKISEVNAIAILVQFIE
jgi:hypothetical protein